MLRLFLQRFHFSTLKDLNASFLEIQNVSSHTQKSKLFKKYVSTLENTQAITLQKLLHLCFSNFSRLNDKRIIQNCQGIFIKKEDISKSLEKQNDLKKTIAKLYNVKNKQRNLSLEEIYKMLIQIRDIKGLDSTDRKMSVFNDLLSSCKDENQRKLICSLVTNQVRIGIHQKIIFDIFEELQLANIKNIQHKYNCMLSKPLKDFDDAIKFMKNTPFAAQYKFDGQRTHIQYSKIQNQIGLYSRNDKNQQGNYPDLPILIKNQLDQIPNLQSCILDGEIICVDKQGIPANIGVLLSRKAKNISFMSDQYKEKVKIFDILQLNGKSLIKLPYEERIKLIPIFAQTQILNNTQRQIFQFPKQINEFKNFFKNAIELKYQGLILKKLSSFYNTTMSKTDWAKLKKGETQNGTIGRQVDVDLIMMGAYKGKGKRMGIFGSFLFGIYYEGKIYPITKSGSSLTQQMFEQVTNEINQHITQQIPRNYVIPKGLRKPDVWVKPNLIVEIASQEWTRSPIYEFNNNNEGGLSLRFPRFIRIRKDKNIQSSTQGDQVLQQIE